MPGVGERMPWESWGGLCAGETCCARSSSPPSWIPVTRIDVPREGVRYSGVCGENVVAEQGEKRDVAPIIIAVGNGGRGEK